MITGEKVGLGSEVEKYLLVESCLFNKQIRRKSYLLINRRLFLNVYPTSDHRRGVSKLIVADARVKPGVKNIDE
jgi:hypothetical protein